MALVETRFGDEQSTLFDEFERLAFEAHAAQLNRVMLNRSLSEPKLQKSHSTLIGVPPIPLMTRVMQEPGTHHHRGRSRGRSDSGFHKVLKKLLRPIIGRKRGGRSKQQVEDDNEDLLSCKIFSRSLRF